ncbi:MAG: phosphopantothenoylcysteine decarboxylase [Phycisphaerae bacterium]
MNLLVTAGPTREYFDSVRFISNASSGRMGYNIAIEALRRGHNVTLVSGPVELPPPPEAHMVNVVSAEEMYHACCRVFSECHAAIMTAAVCDYRPEVQEQRKIKKDGKPRSFEMVPTRDICAHLGSIKGHRRVIGFAMEDHDAREHAREKLLRKNCDAIILNHPDNLGLRSGNIEILQADGTWSGPFLGSKSELAGRILNTLEIEIGVQSGGAGIQESATQPALP